MDLARESLNIRQHVNLITSRLQGPRPGRKSLVDIAVKLEDGREQVFAHIARFDYEPMTPALNLVKASGQIHSLTGTQAKQAWETLRWRSIDPLGINGPWQHVQTPEAITQVHCSLELWGSPPAS